MFKYATREISDDNAIELIERFLEIVDYLIKPGDKSDNWQIRKTWLLNCIESVMRKPRCLPPAFLRCYLVKISIFPEAIGYFKNQTENGNGEKQGKTFLIF